LKLLFVDIVFPAIIKPPGFAVILSHLKQILPRILIILPILMLDLILDNFPQQLEPHADIFGPGLRVPDHIRDPTDPPLDDIIRVSLPGPFGPALLIPVLEHKGIAQAVKLEILELLVLASFRVFDCVHHLRDLPLDVVFLDGLENVPFLDLALGGVIRYLAFSQALGF
jgi:hypothetical protein